MKRQYTYMIAFALLGVLLSLTSSSFGQGGGRETTTSTSKKTTTPTKKTAAPEQQACSAQSPRQASGRTHTVYLGNGESIDLIEMPKGSFCMDFYNRGSSSRRVRLVRINYLFYMSQYEITQGQWQAVMGSNSSFFKNCPRCPIESISRNDMQRFLEKINQIGVVGYSYRLPTSAEWEYAARASTKKDYANNLIDIAWYSENSGKRTHEVGQKQPNAWGLYDMNGNVWEACDDLPKQVDPVYGIFRAWRGGSWASPLEELRLSFHFSITSEEPHYALGFRIVAVARK